MIAKINPPKSIADMVMFFTPSVNGTKGTFESPFFSDDSVKRTRRVFSTYIIEFKDNSLLYATDIGDGQFHLYAENSFLVSSKN